MRKNTACLMSFLMVAFLLTACGRSEEERVRSEIQSIQKDAQRQIQSVSQDMEKRFQAANASAQEKITRIQEEAQKKIMDVHEKLKQKSGQIATDANTKVQNLKNEYGAKFQRVSQDAHQKISDQKQIQNIETLIQNALQSIGKAAGGIAEQIRAQAGLWGTAQSSPSDHGSGQGQSSAGADRGMHGSDGRSD